MSRTMQNTLRVTAVIIAAAGIPAAFLMVNPGLMLSHVRAGIMAGFVLAGLFVWFLTEKKPEARKTAATVIMAGGAVAAFLIGFRRYGPAPVWTWDRNYYLAAIITGPHFDWTAALVTSGIFIGLGLALRRMDTAPAADRKDFPRTSFAKWIVVAQNILLGTIIAVAASHLMFGGGTIYIADYMPGAGRNTPFEMYIVRYLILHLSILLVPVSAVALPQLFALNKFKVLSVKEDADIIVLFWLIPLIACAFKLIPQYGATW